ncbi:MAG: MFS transporter [Gemmatimonadota bacterium]
MSAPATAAPLALRTHVITRRSVVSWVMYDLANTIFSMGVVSMYFSLYIRSEVGPRRADSAYGLITAVSMGIIFVISPMLGAMTDRARRRMPFLMWSTMVCVALTALLGRVEYSTTLLLFVVANAAYQAGLQFYDAMLPEVSTEANRGRVSGIGIGVGYLGSFIAVGLGMYYGSDNLPRLFGLIAMFFLAFAVPCFLFVRERGNANPRPVFDWAAMQGSARDTLATIRNGHRYPGLIRFLVGRVFYTDAVTTVITIMTLYTVNVAVASGQSEVNGRKTANLVMMVAITFAVLGGFAWGRLVDRIGPKRTLNIVLAQWVATFVAAAMMGLLQLPLAFFYVVASSAGIAMGGVQAADRPLMLRLTPPDRIGEFYGLYGMVGRFSAISGPIIWAIVAKLTIESGLLKPAQGQGVGVLVLMLLVILSYLILRPVTDEKRDWSHLSGVE